MMKIHITAVQIAESIRSRDPIVLALLDIAAREKVRFDGGPLVMLVQFPGEPDGGVLLDITPAHWWDRLRFRWGRE